MARYVINDDDYEDWIKKLEAVLVSDEDIEAIMSDIEYVVSEMKIELQQHRKTDVRE